MTDKKASRWGLEKKILSTGISIILCGTLIIQTTKAEEENNPLESRKITNMSLAQIVRRLVGLPQEVSAGGSRSGFRTKSKICLINPAIKISNSQNIATTSMNKPIIITSSKLNELKIREATGQKTILFRASSSSTEAVETPIKWPIKPIRPNEKYILEFRDINSPASEIVEVLLVSQDQRTMADSQKLIREFNSKETATARKLHILKESSPEIAINLIFSLNSKNNQQLKEELAKGCRP